MKKKIVKIIGVFILVFVVLAIALPLFFEGKISAIIKNKVNQNINATLDFKDANLSLIKSFPNAYLDLKKVSLVNNVPFEGDTLFFAGDIELDMSIKELFKSAEESIIIKNLRLHNGKLKIKIDAQENANYDISVEDETNVVDDETKANSFKLGLESYEITNTDIVYDDFANGMHLDIKQMNHFGSGDLSLEQSKLQTKTDALLSFKMDSTQYFSNTKIVLDANIGIDLNESKYTFLENKALINQLPLVFNGFIKQNLDNQQVDISFKTPSSEFKNFLGVFPAAYAANLDDVTTTGNFEVKGQFKGVVDNNYIPKFNIDIFSENASFKYADLPKTVKDVYINTQIKNESGVIEDTYVNINGLHFKIDEDSFSLDAKIRELLGNTRVRAHMEGIINLGNIAKAYPMPIDYKLAGIINADITTSFDMASIEKHRYENTETSGKASLKGFHYESEELKNPVDIKEAALTFNPKTVVLNAFEAKTGQTDVKAYGAIDNLLGYVFNEESMEGSFKLRSNTLAMDDFMVEESQEDETGSATEMVERIKIPSFLNATIDASANNVLYDNLKLKNVSGILRIKDESAILKNLNSQIFGGKIDLNGQVSTKGKESTFEMDMDIANFKIAESFKSLELFKVLAPIANALQGKLNSNLKIAGNLNNDMTPNLATLSGNVLAQLLGNELNTENTPLLEVLDGKLDFLDLKVLDVKDIKTALSFEKGAVKVKPFKLKYKDIDITVDGEHSFDQKMDYKATFNVPAKYLGSKVSNLITKIHDDSLEDLTIPVTASLGGNFKSPSVTTDLTSGVKNLTSQLVEIQKQKLIKQGKNEAKNLLGGLLGNTDKSVDTTESSSKGESTVNDVLGGLLGNGKKDSISPDSKANKNDAVKDAATNIIGGLLGKKKKDTTKQE